MSIGLSTLIPLSWAEAKNNLIEPFINACRLCLWKRDKMIHFGQNVDLMSKINSCLPTIVSETDELPKYICCECFYKLNMLYEFHKMCARADYILKSYIFKSSRSMLRSKVPEKEKANCVEAVQLFKQSCNSIHDVHDSSANGQCLEMVETEEQETSLFCGIEKFPSNSKENETFLPRQQIVENKVHGYILNNQCTNTESCNNKDIDENGQSGNINNLIEVIDIFKDERCYEGGNSEFLVNCGSMPSSHLSIESVYTVETENKENVCHIQPGQLSERSEEYLELNMNSKNLDDQGMSFNYNPNSVCETDVNSRVSKECQSGKKIEKLRIMSHSSSELNSIDYQNITRHDEICPPPVNHTDQGIEIGTSAVCPGYSSNIQPQFLQDSDEKIKTEYQKTSLRQKVGNDLQPEHLHSIISGVKLSDPNWKTYLSGTKVLMPNLWKQCLKFQEKKSDHNPKLYRCNKCQKFLKNAYSLRRHMLVHTGVKPYKCPYCVRSFAFGFGFSVHIRTHTGERPYKCCECNKDFMDKPSLNRHMRKHTGVTPYGCNICHKQFYTNSSLKSHGKVHSQLYAFSCCECSKDFKRFYSLNLHMRLHTGFRPYKCPECEYTFIKCAHLKQHLRVHTGYKPFKCVKCSKTFSQYSNYRIHIRKHVKGIKVENNVVCF